MKMRGAATPAVLTATDVKRDTGRGWAILTQHPGIDERIERLRCA